MINFNIFNKQTPIPYRSVHDVALGDEKQVAQLSQRDRAAWWSIVAKSRRRYSAGLSLTTVT